MIKIKVDIDTRGIPGPLEQLLIKAETDKELQDIADILNAKMRLELLSAMGKLLYPHKTPAQEFDDFAAQLKTAKPITKYPRKKCFH